MPAAYETLPPARRLLARGALLAGELLWRGARRGAARGAGRVLVSFANLGDQLRMLNVYSRLDPAPEPADVVCNDAAAEIFALYDGFARIAGFAHQGAGTLARSALHLYSGPKPYALALVPQPFVTAPIALAYGATHAAAVLAHGDGPERTWLQHVPVRARSWRGAYEHFFLSAFPGATLADRPRLRAPFRRTGDGGEHIVVHLSTSARARALEAGATREVLELLVRAGHPIVLVGAAAERAALHALCRDLPIDLRCGTSFADVAALLARARAFVGVDSSIMNFADAVGTPSVVLYTATGPAVAGPYYTPFEAVVPRAGYAPAGVETRTQWERPSAAGEIEPAAVAAAVARLIAAPRM